MPIASRLYPPGTAPVDLHPALERVRQMPDFQTSVPMHDWLRQWLDKLDPQWGSWLDSQWRALQDALEALVRAILRWLPSDAFQGSPLALSGWMMALLQGLLWLVGVSAVLGVFLWGGAWVKTRYRRWQRRQPNASEPMAEVEASAQALRREAARLAAQGEFEAAMRPLYHAAVKRLDETGCLPFDASRTRLEILRRLNPDTLRAPFSILSQAFEAVQFGKRALDAERFRQAEACEAALQDALTRQPAAQEARP